MKLCAFCRGEIGTNNKAKSGKFCSHTCYLSDRKKRNFEAGLCFCGKEREGESKNCRGCLDKNRDINRVKRGYRGGTRACPECYETGHTSRTCPMKRAA